MRREAKVCRLEDGKLKPGSDEGKRPSKELPISHVYLNICQVSLL
jgi:hypothetical protein